MGEIRHRYVWYDGSSKQSGGGQASISQRHLGSDVLTSICSENKKTETDNIDWTMKTRMCIDTRRRTEAPVTWHACSLG